MLQQIKMIQGLINIHPTLAQIPIDTTPSEATPIIFSSPQLLIALLAGVVMAIAFQLLFTNLSLAFIISPSGAAKLVAEDLEETESLTDAARNLETKIGLWSMITVSLALFTACFLAVKLSLVSNMLLGATLGVVVWATFFSFLAWKGSSSAGSLLGSLLNTATSGVQGLFGTATSAIGANVARQQAVSTAEDITAAVRRELTSGLNPDKIQKTLQSSLNNLSVPNLDVSKLRTEFEKILQNADLKEILDSDLLHSINRQTLTDLVKKNTNLSGNDINQIAETLEGALKTLRRPSATAIQQQVRSFIEGAMPETLQSGQLVQQLEHLIARSTGQPSTKVSLANRALDTGFELLGAIAQGKVDLSNLDAHQVSTQVEQLIQKILDQGETLTLSPQDRESHTVQADVQHYIANAFPWQLSGLSVIEDFQRVLHNRDADQDMVRQQLESLNQESFTQLLQQRGDMNPQQIQEISELMNDIRRQVLDIVIQSGAQAQASETEESPQLSQTLQDEAKSRASELRQKVEDYLRNTNQEALDPDAIEREVRLLFEDPQAGFEALKQRLSQFDRDTLVQLLSQREDLSEERVQQILDRIESVRDNVLQTAETAIQQIRSAPKRLAGQVQQKALNFESSVAQYLRNTNKEELNPDGIKRDLKILLTDPRLGLESITDRITQFDRSTLVALLAQRQDLTEAEANEIVERILSARDGIMHQIQSLQQRLQSVMEDSFAQLRTYLNSLERSELNYDGVKNDFIQLFEDPQAGFEALRDRLGQFDRGTLVALLSSRKDISEAEANRIIDQVEAARDSVLNQADYIQREAQKRIASVKKQTKQQLLETRKVAADATWWIFNTAFTSLAASAVAGAIAVIQLG
jgi:hypothetical protein